jgi:hypothetical protein
MDLDTVTLKIDEAEITVYKALLTTVSDYFRNAFDGPFREANERYITLEGVSERSLRMFLQWTYAQSLQFDTSSAALGFDALLPSDVAKGINQEATTSVEVTDTIEEAEDDPTATADSETGSSPLFNEKWYHAVSTRQQPYPDNKDCMKTVDELYLGLTELYIFGDKYSVPQLRDDVVTAFVGQCWKWDLFPAENDEALILLTATNLPASSKLRKFLACSIAWVGVNQPDSNPEHIMRSLQELDPDLAVEVGITYALKVHEADASGVYQVSTDLDDHLPNACIFHDHTHLNQDQCRRRIASRPHIFTAILDACAKAVWTKPAKED